MATTVEAAAPSLVDKRAQRQLEHVIKAADRTLAVRREVFDLCRDGVLDEHFIAIILALYRAERDMRRKL